MLVYMQMTLKSGTKMYSHDIVLVFFCFKNTKLQYFTKKRERKFENSALLEGKCLAHKKNELCFLFEEN